MGRQVGHVSALYLQTAPEQPRKIIRGGTPFGRRGYSRMYTAQPLAWHTYRVAWISDSSIRAIKMSLASMPVCRATYWLSIAGLITYTYVCGLYPCQRPPNGQPTEPVRSASTYRRVRPVGRARDVHWSSETNDNVRRHISGHSEYSSEQRRREEA